MRRKAKEERFEHEVFIGKDIRDIVKLCSEAIALWAYGHIFCAWLHSGACYQTLLTRKEEVPSGEQVDSEESVVQKKVFNEGKKPLHYTNATGNYSCDPRPN